MGKWFPGFRTGARHQPGPARDPRPDGAQKGVTKRVHQHMPHSAGGPGRARTPWLLSGSGRDSLMRRDEPSRWTRTRGRTR